MELGARAQLKNQFTWFSRGENTIEKLVSRLAPPTENDTESYINFIARKMNVPRNRTLIFSPEQQKDFAYWCNVMESGIGHAVRREVYNEAYKLL